MIKTNISFLILCCLFLFITNSVLGAGFSIFEQGAAATGMAGAFSAQADDPSAVFFNPAGILQLEGTQISIGDTLISPTAKVTDPYGKEWKAKSQNFYPANFYLTQKVGDQFAFGFSYGAYYGLGMNWTNNSDFYYRYIVNKVDVAAHYFSPVIAFKINDNFAIAGGLNYVLSNVDISKKVDMYGVNYQLSQQFGGLPFNFDNTDLKLKGDNGSGDLGFNAALHSKFDSWRFGLVYRSEVKCSYEGDADFTYIPGEYPSDFPTGFPSAYANTVNASLADKFRDTTGKTSITMPASASFGIAHDFSKTFTLEFDLNWMGWSSYKSLDVAFDSDLPTEVSPKDWKDVFSYRLGAKYCATEKLDLYAGYYFDESPIPDKSLDPILPDADRQSLQIGAGYKICNWKISCSYMALFFNDRETTSYEYKYPNHDFNGEYKNFASLVGLQLTYAF
jgi:long-chain fatty acid transport protein